MKYCPHCEAEYHEKIDVCADCDEQLISHQEFEKRKEEEERFHEETKTLVKVFTLKDRFEADVITRELEKERIPVCCSSGRASRPTQILWILSRPIFRIRSV